jgi:molybdenum cofactor cytidylyltransferase
VALADMPFIRAETFRAVREALESGALIAAPIDRASGRRGHPVGFSTALREELLELDGDEGARSVIARHLESVVLVAVDDPGIFRDIDRPEDLDRNVNRGGDAAECEHRGAQRRTEEPLE